MKKWLIISVISLSALMADEYPGIRGDIQIQTSKTLNGKGNVDQLYGRANLKWAFAEKAEKQTLFSSLVHVRVYPSGFGFEPLLGASFNKSTTNATSPAISTQTPPNEAIPTLQIYQAWIQYRFSDFNLRVGRLVTNDTKSLHFGNYLDFAPGGQLTFSRDGLHNALEFYQPYQNFMTKILLGIGDSKGNRGFFRFHEKISINYRLSLNLGYRVNVFDLIHYDWNDSAAQLRNTLTFGGEMKFSKTIEGYLETSWSHLKGQDHSNPIPLLLGLDYKLSENKSMAKIVALPDKIRLELEYISDRKIHYGPYNGIDQDVLWNVYFEKTWLKRMFFQISAFAAPSKEDVYNAGLGVRFTSKIN